MATTSGGIATELEAKIKLGLSTDPIGFDSSRGITKSRVYNPFGGSVLNSNSYYDYQCVKYSDITTSGPTPTLYNWYTCNDLAEENNPITSQTAPIPPDRLDANFLFYTGISGDKYADYELLSCYEFAKYYETTIYNKSYNDLYQLPFPIIDSCAVDACQTGNGKWSLAAISGCTPFLSIIQSITSDFDQVFPECVNNDSYPDYDGGHLPAIMLQFPEFDKGGGYDASTYIIGSIRANGHDVNTLLNTLKTNHTINMKFGLDFEILLCAKNPNPITMMTYGMNIHPLSHITESYYLNGKMSNINLNVSSDYTGYIGINAAGDYLLSSNDITELDYPLFKVHFKFNDKGDTILIRFTRIGNTGDNETYFIPYIMNVAFDLSSDNSTKCEPINFYYNYDTSFTNGVLWKNIYNHILANAIPNTLGFGLDALAMYRIKFLTGFVGDELDSDFLTENVNDLISSIKPITNISFGDYNFDSNPWTFDLCIPNQTDKFAININVDADGDVQGVYKKNFALSYLRAPVYFDVHTENSPDHPLAPLNENNIYALNESYNYSMFFYEMCLKHYDSIGFDNYYGINACGYYMSIALQTDGLGISFNRLLKFNVPLIVFYDPMSDPDLGYYWEDGFIRILWDNDYCEKTRYTPWDSNAGSFYESFIRFGNGWFGMPEYMFFMANNGAYNNNSVKNIFTVDRPRAVNVTISLDGFGSLYNEFYSNSGYTDELYPNGVVLDQLFIYYKTYFYHYYIKAY